MNESEATQTGNPRRRRIRRWLGIGAIVLLAMIWSAWNLIPALTIDAPVQLERGPDGVFRAIGGEAETSPGFALQANQLVAQNNTSTISSSSQSDPAYFPSRTLWLVNRSDHLLMKRVGEALVKTLQEPECQFDRLEYYPAGTSPPSGTRGPDLYLTLDMPEFYAGGVIDRSLTATVTAGLGTSLVSSNSSYNDNLTPPTVNLRMQIEVDHRSTLVGLESSAAEYLSQGKDIAKKIAEAAAKQIAGLREKSEPMPELPAEFYPEWSAAPEFAFLGRLQAQPLGASHGLMVHNESCWMLPHVGDPASVVARIHDELEASGWSGGPRRIDSADSIDLRMTQGAQVLEIFTRRDSLKINFADIMNPPTTNVRDLIVRFTDRMETGELHAAVEKIFEREPVDVELLLRLQRYASSDQSQRLIAKVESSPPKTVGAWQILTEHYVAQKDAERAKDALRRTYYLALALPDGSAVKRRVEESAKKLNVDVKEFEAIDPAILAELGFVALNAPPGPKHIDVRPGESACFYNSKSPGEWSLLAVTLKPVGKRNGRDAYKMVILDAESGGSSSWSTQTVTSLEQPIQSGSNVNGRSLHVTVQEAGDQRIRVTVE